VRRLRDFFRDGSTRLERVPVGELLETVRRHAVHAKAISLTIAGEPGLPDLLVDRLQIELVLRNLISNAAEAIDPGAPGGGRIALSATRQDPQHVRIIVADNGPGVPAASRERVFEPFVSGKPTGMGLGLAVSRAIAEAHGGTLEALTGTHGEFHLVLPVEAGRG
jgi:two-component system sensor kinase FixL